MLFDVKQAASSTVAAGIVFLACSISPAVGSPGGRYGAVGSDEQPWALAALQPLLGFEEGTGSVNSNSRGVGLRFAYAVVVAVAVALVQASLALWCGSRTRRLPELVLFEGVDFYYKSSYFTVRGLQKPLGLDLVSPSDAKGKLLGGALLQHVAKGSNAAKWTSTSAQGARLSLLSGDLIVGLEASPALVAKYAPKEPPSNKKGDVPAATTAAAEDADEAGVRREGMVRVSDWPLSSLMELLKAGPPNVTLRLQRRKKIDGPPPLPTLAPLSPKQLALSSMGMPPSLAHNAQGSSHRAPPSSRSGGGGSLPPTPINTNLPSMPPPASRAASRPALPTPGIPTPHTHMPSPAAMPSAGSAAFPAMPIPRQNLPRPPASPPFTKPMPGSLPAFPRERLGSLPPSPAGSFPKAVPNIPSPTLRGDKNKSLPSFSQAGRSPTLARRKSSLSRMTRSPRRISTGSKGSNEGLRGPGRPAATAGGV